MRIFVVSLLDYKEWSKSLHALKENDKLVVFLSFRENSKFHAEKLEQSPCKKEFFSLKNKYIKECHEEVFEKLKIALINSKSDDLFFIGANFKGFYEKYAGEIADIVKSQAYNEKSFYVGKTKKYSNKDKFQKVKAYDIEDMKLGLSLEGFLENDQNDDKKNEEIIKENIEDKRRDIRIGMEEDERKPVENAKVILISELLKRIYRRMDKIFAKCSVLIQKDKYYAIIILLLKTKDKKEFVSSFEVMYPAEQISVMFSDTDYKNLKNEAVFYDGVIKMLYQLDPEIKMADSEKEIF